MKKIKKCKNCGKIQFINDGEFCKNCHTMINAHTNQSENAVPLQPTEENRKYYLSSINGLQECKALISDKISTIKSNDSYLYTIAFDVSDDGLFTGEFFTIAGVDFENNKYYYFEEHIDEKYKEYNKAEIEELTSDEDSWKKSDEKFLYENIDIFNPKEIHNNYKKVVTALKVDEAYLTSLSFYASNHEEDQHIKYSFSVSYAVTERELFKYIKKSKFNSLLEEEGININYLKIFATVNLDVHYDGKMEFDKPESDEYNVRVLSMESRGAYMNSIEIQIPYPNIYI